MHIGNASQPWLLGIYVGQNTDSLLTQAMKSAAYLICDNILQKYPPSSKPTTS